MFKDIKFNSLSVSICIMVAIINLDFTAMSILLNDFQLLYHITLDKTQKIVSLYLFFAASFFIVSGKLIDTFSPAKIYTLGVIIFYFSIPFVLFDTSLEVIYIARCLQGMSYPLIFNSGAILLNALYPPENKISGVTLIIFISSLMQILGPGVASMLVELQGWKGIFYFIGFASTLSILLLFIVRSKNIPLIKPSTDKFDIRGCLLFLLFCGVISYPLLYNIGFEKTIMMLILATCCSLVFIYATYRNKVSFLDVSLLKDKYFFSIVLLRFFSNICWSILILYIPTYLQQNYAFTSYEAGIFILITSSVAAVWVLLSDYITKKWGTYRSLLFPTLCLMILHLIMLGIGKSPTPLLIVILLIMYGFTGLITPTLTKSCLHHIEEKKKGQGMGIYYTLSLLSMGIGGILLGKFSAILEYIPFIGNYWNIISLICIFLYAISLITLTFIHRCYQEKLIATKLLFVVITITLSIISPTFAYAGSEEFGKSFILHRFENHGSNTKLRALEVYHPSYFAGFTGTDLQLANRIRHIGLYNKVPELAVELRKIYNFVNKNLTGKHSDEFASIKKELEKLLLKPEEIVGLDWLYFAFRTAMVGRKLSVNERGFFEGAGFGSLYDMARIKSDEPFIFFLSKILENGFDDDSRNVLVTYVDSNKEFEKQKYKNSFYSINYPLPNHNVLGYFYLAYTFLNGIHPIPIPSKSESEELHGMYMTPWGVFCHDFAHSEAASTNHSAEQFAHNLLNHYHQMLKTKLHEHPLKSRSVSPLTFEEKRRAKLSAMIDPIASFAYKIHNAYYQSLAEALELTLESIDPTKPLASENKAYWVGAFYYAHEKVPDMSYKYGSRDFEELLRKSIQHYGDPTASTAKAEDMDVSVPCSNLFRTSYLTGESKLINSEIFDIVKRLKLSRYRGMDSHYLGHLDIPLNEKNITDYTVTKNKFYITVKIQVTNGRVYVFRENTNYDIRLNFKHDYGILKEAEPVLFSKYGYTLPTIPNPSNFEGREAEYEIAAKACAEDLKKGLSYLQQHFMETTIKLSKQIRHDGLASIADRFTATYDAELAILRKALPSFISDIQTFIEDAVSSPQK